MKIILTIIIFIPLLVGCGNPLTRIIPKAEKLEPPTDLMASPKDLKIINKPTNSNIPSSSPQSELTRDVSPEKK